MISYEAKFNPVMGKVELITSINVTGKNHTDPAIRQSTIVYTREKVEMAIQALEKNRNNLTDVVYLKVLEPYQLVLNVFNANPVFN